MKNYLRLAAILTFASFVPAAAGQTPAPNAAPAAAPGGSPEQSIRQLEGALNEALQKADTAALDKLLAEEWFVKNNARVATKAQLLEVLKANGSQWASIKDEGVEVRLHESAAVVSGVSVRRLLRDDGGDLRFRFTRVYAKRPAGWQLVAMHVEEVR